MFKNVTRKLFNEMIQKNELSGLIETRLNSLTYFEVAAVAGDGEIGVAFHSDEASIVAGQAEIAEQVLVVALLASAVTETCSPSSHFLLHLPTVGFVRDESAEGYLRVVAPEFDALESPFAFFSVQNGKANLWVMTSSLVERSIVGADAA